MMFVSFIAWYGGISARDKNNLSTIKKVAGKLIGSPQLSLLAIYEKQVIQKARNILDCTNHPFIVHLKLFPQAGD